MGSEPGKSLVNVNKYLQKSQHQSLEVLGMFVCLLILGFVPRLAGILQEEGS